MSIEDKIQREILKLRERGQVPTIINLTTDEGFELLESFIHRVAVKSDFGFNLEKLLISRDVDELVGLSGKVSYYGLCIYFNKTVQ
jgi:hypothetical protein